MLEILPLTLSGLFILSVIFIWFMIAYQMILTVAGYSYYLQSMREKTRIDGMTSLSYPKVCVLIPAHNEEAVIEKTLAHMLSLDYPREELEILVINDGSTDRTGEIVREVARRNPQISYCEIPKGEGGRGKSRVLNLGWRKTDAQVIAVYDADNQPLPSALKYLVAELLLHPELAAVLGNFRTLNREKNWLTRFISVETLSFQSILQAGRWKLFRISTLPGTNLIIWRHVLDALDGWDEDAITEDSELSMRLYQQGYRIKYVPFAVTYEQEPETLRVWIGQRTRWVRGNNYVLMKFLREIPRFQNRLVAVEMFYLLALYYVFLFALAISDLVFLLGVTNLLTLQLPGPYTLVWVFAILLFILEILLVLSYEGEGSLRNLLIVIAMYFTYCQLWILVVVKGIYLDFIKREKRSWVKTERFRPLP